MRLITLLAGLLVATQAFADSIDFGQASKYNAFVKKDYTASSSDVQGRVAVGGNLNVVKNQWGGSGGYEVGNKIIDFNMGSGPSLVVGGDINKDGVGHFNIYQTATLPTPVMGDVVLGGTINGGPVDYANAYENSASLPVNFDSAFQHLENLSQQLANKTETASVVVDGSQLRFNVDPSVIPSDGVYVFNVTEQMLKNQWGGTRTDWIVDTDNMVAGATVVFNVTNEQGQTVTMPQANVFLGDTTNPLSAHFDKDLATNTAPIQVLYNFYGASELNLNSDLYGSILAPTADIKSNQAVIWGQVMGQSWQGNMQINYNPFTPVGTPPTAVPETNTVWLFLLATALLLMRTVKRTTRKNKNTELPNVCLA